MGSANRAPNGHRKDRKRTAKHGKWGVYLLQCADGSFYCGVTNDLKKRIAAHNAGKGARYTRGRRPVKLKVFSGLKFTYGVALKHEHATKQLPRSDKAAFVRKLRVGG